MNQKIIVFVKNKLITLDTVIPVLLEMKIRHNVSSEIIVFNKETHDAIQKNVVLRDAVNYVGSELFITKGNKVKILRYVIVLISLIRIMNNCIKGGKIIHFRDLDVWPLKIFALLFYKNIYRMQSTAYDFKYSRVAIFDKRKITSSTPVGKNMITCSKKYFINADIEKKIYKIGETRTRKSWIKYIDSKSEYYFSRYHANIDTSNGFVVYILGGIDREFTYNLFLSTIKELSHATRSIPILIKPHAYTNMDNLKKGIAGLDLFHITYLHPSILATRARVFVANGFTNTFGDAHSYGLKTVQYSNFTPNKNEYPNCSADDMKKRSEEEFDPEFVEYFINNDSNNFLKVMRNILKEKYKKSSFKGCDTGDNGLFQSFLD